MQLYSLCLPVKPKASRTVMEMVSSNDHIDRRMHLDAAALRTRTVLFVVDMVNMIVLNDREHTTSVSYTHLIFIEISHGPTLVDNNVLLSDRAMKLATQGRSRGKPRQRCGRGNTPQTGW